MENQNNIRNLDGTEAVQKLQELIKAEPMCHFVTNLAKAPLSSRPMSTIKVDDEGNAWFFSARSSAKNMDVSLNNSVQLFYSNAGSSEYLNIYGKAFIVTDR